MPFDLNNPPDKIRKLSPKKQRQFFHVYNSCWEKNADEKTCHMQAWGVVKKTSSENIADIVSENPEFVVGLEKALGMRWNDTDEKFDALSYPNLPRDEVDSVDNAPGGITAAMDLDNASLKEVYAISNMMGSENFNAHDCAYASYCFDALDVVKNSSIADKLQRNVLATYRKSLLGWFKDALIERSNLIQVKGLGKTLSGFVQDVPNAVLTDGTPDVSKFKEDWSFLNADRLAMAGRKVVKVVKEDSIEAGMWEEDSFSVDEPPIYFSKTYKVWNIPYSDWTYQNKRLLSKFGFRIDRRMRWWYVSELTPRLKQMFDVNGKNQNVEVMIPPTRSELNDWYLKTWLPSNVVRFKKLFEGYVRESGSTLQFNFNVNTKGKVNVGLKRGITKLSDSIEELRLRYINRQGRETWLAVMSYAIKLFHTKGQSSMGIIDKMNNLEHSNGMFMEKFPTDVKSWYLKFLNAKFSAPKVTQLAKYIKDKDLRELIIFFANDLPDLIKHPDYRLIEKEMEEGEDWLALGYPYTPGTRKPKKTDPRVQENLKTLREKGANILKEDALPMTSERIVREITNAMRDIKVALRCKSG